MNTRKWGRVVTIVESVPSQTLFADINNLGTHHFNKQSCHTRMITIRKLPREEKIKAVVPVRLSLNC